MLGFFRKYQKFMFIIVTFFIVVSFVFFGTSNTIGPSEEAAPNKPIGKLVDGSKLRIKLDLQYKDGKITGSPEPILLTAFLNSMLSSP